MTFDARLARNLVFHETPTGRGGSELRRRVVAGRAHRAPHVREVLAGKILVNEEDFHKNNGKYPGHAERLACVHLTGKT